jgi:hypothetical protein
MRAENALARHLEPWIESQSFDLVAQQLMHRIAERCLKLPAAQHPLAAPISREHKRGSHAMRLARASTAMEDLVAGWRKQLTKRRNYYL